MSKVQSGQIPDLLKIGSIPVNTAQDVETSVLEPVVHSNTFCRFVFQNKGILHSHSKIELAIEPPDVAGHRHILPIGVGAYSLIERVALKVGTKTICEIEDFANYYAYKSMFVPNEHNKERECVLNGRALALRPAYANGADTAGESQGGFESDSLAVGLELDFANQYSDTSEGTLSSDNNLNGVALDLRLQERDAQPSDGSGPHSGWQLSLSELCPFLKMNQLPLFMLKEQVSLEIHFTKDGSPATALANLPNGHNAGTASNMRVVGDTGEPASGASPIVLSRTRLIADYIFYPQELMEQYRNANKNMSFTYVDYRLSKMSVPPAELSAGVIRNLGGAGRIVSKVFWGLQDQECSATCLLGNYYSQGPLRDYTNVDDNLRKNGKTTMNLKYNDNFLYPIDVVNSSRHFHNIQQTEGLVPFVNRECYSAEGRSLSTRTCMGRPLGGDTYPNANVSPQLTGKFNWYAMRLNKNERINSRGIELYFTYDALPDPYKLGVAVPQDNPGRGYVQRAWLEVIRTATLTDGYVQCYYA